VIDLWVELSRENLPLAARELEATVAALGGEMADGSVSDSIVAVGLPTVSAGRELAARIALARRVLLRWPESEVGAIAARIGRDVHPGDRTSFRRVDRPTSRSGDPALDAWVRAVRAAGGTLDLDAPTRQFRFLRAGDARWQFAEQLSEVDRSSFDARRMPRLPFRRPVSLAPRLGRVAANLARIRPGDRVVDPFVGTGALAIECALLGARVTGIDNDAEMARGALANFDHVGVAAASMVVDDSAAVAPDGVYDAIVTDPPYGRASPTGGEDAEGLARRVVSHWARSVRPGGRVVVIVPGGGDPVGPPWRRELSVADRVHGSLTREFRVYRRPEGA
jgi:tRNA (guanine10-N2)-dimethyltransferase